MPYKVSGYPPIRNIRVEVKTHTTLNDVIHLGHMPYVYACAISYKENGTNMCYSIKNNLKLQLPGLPSMYLLVVLLYPKYFTDVP